jgi:hypothetical protein
MQEELLKAHYWHLVLWDGETIKVKPQNAEAIQGKIESAEGAISTNTRTILIKNIKDFRESDEVYTDQKLLEGAAQALNQPITFTREVKEFGYTEEVTECKWVSKTITQREWQSYYSASPAYRKIKEDDRVTIAFRVLTHPINPQTVHELTPEEILLNNLEK